MRSVLLYGVLGHILRNKIKYILLSFVFLVGCMSGYYTLENISYSLGSTIKNNLELRYTAPGSDLMTVFLSILFAVLVWFCGYSIAGILFIPLILLFNAALQVFLFRVILIDIGFGGGLLAVLTILLMVLWSASSIVLCEISMGNSIGLMQSRDLHLPITEKAAVIKKKGKAFCIVVFLYIMFSYLIFLVNRAIF